MLTSAPSIINNNVLIISATVIITGDVPDQNLSRRVIASDSSEEHPMIFQRGPTSCTITG